MCIGNATCSGATIRSIHSTIQVSGGNVLNGERIISETNFDDNGTLLIYINWTENNQFDIYCNKTDICKIKCEFSRSCINLNLYCYGDCFVDCDVFSDIKCPNKAYGSYKEWTTNDGSDGEKSNNSSDWIYLVMMQQ